MRLYRILLPGPFRPRRRIRVAGVAHALAALAAYARAYGWAVALHADTGRYVAGLHAEDLDETAGRGVDQGCKPSPGEPGGSSRDLGPG